MPKRRKKKRQMLTIILRSVRGTELVVELKNGIQFRGVLDFVDSNMK